MKKFVQKVKAENVLVWDEDIFLHWEKAITVPAIVAAYLNITQIKNYNYINKLV